jgi:hypothetical protein
MKQDNNMQNKLRWLESDDQINLANVDQHWQQMRTMLQPASYTIKKNLYSRSMLSRVIAGLFILGGVAFILKYEIDRVSKNNTTAQSGFPQLGNSKAAVPGLTDIGLPKTVIAKTKSSDNNLKRIKGNSNIHASTKNSLPVIDTMTIASSKQQSSITNSIAAGSNNDEKDKQQLLELFNTIEKPSQQFAVNNFRDTSLLCTEGTRVFIPAGVFVNANNMIAGEVTVQIKEFYSYQDIISHKLSTTSNGRQLVSGGMLYIMAMKNGEEVKLAETKKMTVRMPAGNYDEEMQLFTAEKQATAADSHGSDFAYDYNSNNNINWQPAGQFQRLARTKFFIKIFDPYGSPYASKERNDGTTVAWFVIKKNCPMSNKRVMEALRGHYGLFYNKIKLKRSWSNRPGPLLSKQKWPIVGDSIMIEYTMAKQLKLASKSDIEKYEKQLLQDSAAWNEKLKKIPFYEFQISKLGFMNCDRFENDQSPKVEFTLNLGEGENADNFFSVLAFDKYRSVIQGYCGKNKLRFSQIPENANVHLVCVGVKDGKVLSCIQSFQAGKEEVNDLKFKETTPDDFKKQLALLHLK